MPQGQVVVTEQLEQMVLSQAHGAGHNNRMEMIDTIIKQNNMWFPRMQEKVNTFLTQFHPQSQGRVERINQTLKEKLSKICAQKSLNWVTALPIAIMAIRGSTNRATKLTPHKMVTGRRMPRGDRETIEIEDVDKLKSELDKYVTTLTKIHASIFQTESRPRETPDESNRSGPIAVGDLVNIKVYRRKWDEPRREGPYEVTSATHTSIKVQGSNFWYHISHCLKINTNKSEVITHEAKNLFESPEEEALGHCISKDCALGAGIALEFRNRYG